MRFRRRGRDDPKGLIPEPSDEDVVAQFRAWVLDLDHDPGDPLPAELVAAPPAEADRARARFNLVMDAIALVTETEGVDIRPGEMAYLVHHVERCFGLRG